ncbi:MAG: CHAT domain-containing protein [Cyanobacteria bacterium J06623_4]
MKTVVFAATPSQTTQPHAKGIQIAGLLAQSIPTIEPIPTIEQGRAHYETGQFLEAAEAWTLAADALASRGDVVSQASVLSNLALAYQALGDEDLSEAAIAQAHALIDTLLSSPQATEQINVFTIAAQVWNAQGILLRGRSQSSRALEAFQTAAEYYRQAEDNTGVLRSQLNQAQALQSLGFYRRALTLLTDLPTPLTVQPNSTLKVRGMQLQGDLYRSIGDLATAQTTLEEAAEIAQTLDIPHPDLLLSLGHVAEAQGNNESALNYFQQASDRTATVQTQLRAKLSQISLLQSARQSARQSDSPSDSHTQTLTALYLDLQTQLNALPISRFTLNARLDLARQQITDPSISPASIAQQLAAVRQQAQAANDPRAESYALGTLGELYLQGQQLPDAQQALQAALALAEALNASDIAYQWQWQLGQLNRQLNQLDVAGKYYESAVQSLQSLRENLIAIAPDLRFDFREKVEPVYREWVDLLLSETKNTSQNEQPNLVKARQAIESLQLAELENFFQEPCVALSQEIDQVIENTVSPTAVIYPIILPDRLEVILKLPQQPLLSYTAAVSQTDLESLLTSLQRDLLLPFTLNTVQSESAQLYDWLIRPAEAALESNNIDTLVFVLDGFLRSIPMASLYDGQQYLVKKYSIALAPGLQLVDPQPLRRKALAALIAALGESRHGFSELPFVYSEVSQVQQTTDSEVLLNETFTKDNFTTAISNNAYPLVHLATHGQFSSDPDETFVLAWDEPIKVNELNALLRQSEQRRQQAIELLILSACETAAGDKRAALGLAGVAVQAGARSTLASLWSLDDETSALFSNYFYQALKDPNISKAQALRTAQLQLLGDQSIQSTYQHPRYWAPYVLLGNWL